MRLVTSDDLAFYDNLARRIRTLLSRPDCRLSQRSLAEAIDWNRASLCNFLNRTDKTIQAHFIPRIARAFLVSVEQLMICDTERNLAKCYWDPQSDSTNEMIEWITELRGRSDHRVSLHSLIPPLFLPNEGMTSSLVESLSGGKFPTIVHRWCETMRAVRDNPEDGGEVHAVRFILASDMKRLARRQTPYDVFSAEEVEILLDTLKKEWVRKRDLRIVVIEDSRLSIAARRELKGNLGVTVIGDIRVEIRNDLRVHWNDNPKSIAATQRCLAQLKQSAGLAARARPPKRAVERQIDQFLFETRRKARSGHR